MSRVYLRALESEDLEWTHKWHNDPTLYESLVGPFRFVSQEAEREWLREKGQFSMREVNLMICLHEVHAPIGLVSVREIDWVSRVGFLGGIIIGEPQHRGQGLGREALRLLLRHCFLDLGLNKIWTRILADNEASLRLFEASGFQEEGCLRQHAFKQGEFKNVKIFGLCADSFAE